MYDSHLSRTEILDYAHRRQETPDPPHVRCTRLCRRLPRTHPHHEHPPLRSQGRRTPSDPRPRTRLIHESPGVLVILAATILCKKNAMIDRVLNLMFLFPLGVMNGGSNERTSTERCYQGNSGVLCGSRTLRTADYSSSSAHRDEYYGV